MYSINMIERINVNCNFSLPFYRHLSSGFRLPLSNHTRAMTDIWRLLFNNIIHKQNFPIENKRNFKVQTQTQNCKHISETCLHFANFGLSYSRECLPSSLLTKIFFVIQIFDERNKRIFCFKNQCAWVGTLSTT